MQFDIFLMVLCFARVVGQAYKAFQTIDHWPEDVESVQLLLKLTADVIYDTDSIWGQLEKLKYNSRFTAAYEIGYLTKSLQEIYRKQVDVYNTSKWMNARLYLNELILYLDEVEHHYWQVEHMASMMHEIEQKYGVKGALGVSSFEMAPELKKIFQGLSWSARMQLLDKYYPDPHPTNWSMNALLHKSGRRFPIISDRRFERVVAIEALSDQAQPYVRRQSEDPEVKPDLFLLQDDETNMIMKLFRLMYETIRDSDLKVKRAELIKAHYVNSSSFDVGYLLGEVTEKYNIMTDIAATLKRLYNEWKPIEHINAYEQIANQGVEISHLVDIIKTTHKERTKKKKEADAEPEKVEGGPEKETEPEKEKDTVPVNPPRRLRIAAN